MSTLPLSTVNLVSVQSAVPYRGSPTSQDYNDNQNNTLIDLASLTSFLNDTVVPLLEVLPLEAAVAGLEGRVINTDSTNLTPLCCDTLTSTPLTISQSLQYLQNTLLGMQGNLTGLSTQVSVLASQLASTNQNDIALTLQNYQNTLNQMNAALLAIQISGVIAPTTAQMITGAVAPGGEESFDVNWTRSHSDNTYTAVCSIEDTTGFLGIESWAYLPSGAGITVRVSNADTVAPHSGTIHAISYGL